MERAIRPLHLWRHNENACQRIRAVRNVFITARFAVPDASLRCIGVIERSWLRTLVVHPRSRFGARKKAR